MPALSARNRKQEEIKNRISQNSGTNYAEIEPMTIGLIDVDSRKFPNLALMKLSAWHKAQCDTMEWQ